MDLYEEQRLVGSKYNKLQEKMVDLFLKTLDEYNIKYTGDLRGRLKGIHPIHFISLSNLSHNEDSTIQDVWNGILKKHWMEDYQNIVDDYSVIEGALEEKWHNTYGCEDDDDYDDDCDDDYDDDDW